MRECCLVFTLLVLSSRIALAAGCLAWSEDHSSLRDQIIYFDSAGTALSIEAKHKVGEVADYLKANPSVAVRIEGYCDDRGTVEYNLELGDRRAQALREELVRRGIEPVRVDAISFGKGHPAVVGHDVEEARKKNRRAEFVVLRPPKQ